jgi:putative FmdB family regulatory protein
MPLQDYQCGACGHEFEKLVGVMHGVKEPRKCPECGELKLKCVLFTRPATVHMKYSPMHPRAGRGMSRR